VKPLKIALICKNENSKKRNDRAMGYFSYDVPGFTWGHFTPGKNFIIDLDDLKSDGYDLVFHEDYPYGNYIGDSIPVVFLSIDSTLSNEHSQDRFNQSQRANLVLVDHDLLELYSTRLKQPVYQFPYCVNDKIFYRDDTKERINDIAFHCSSSAHVGSDERKRIRRLLHDLSVKHNWSYRSGVLDIHDYAESFRTSKIVVNQSRTPINRPHRIFDAMACGAMVLTSPLPYTIDDKLKYAIDYDVFENDNWLEKQLDFYLNHPLSLESTALSGYTNVLLNHTWSIRAKQLREIINKEFGI